MATIKVVISLEVEIDTEQWDASYGTGEGKRAISADVKAYATNQLQQSGAAADGAILAVTHR